MVPDARGPHETPPNGRGGPHGSQTNAPPRPKLKESRALHHDTIASRLALADPRLFQDGPRHLRDAPEGSMRPQEPKNSKTHSGDQSASRSPDARARAPSGGTMRTKALASPPFGRSPPTRHPVTGGGWVSTSSLCLLRRVPHFRCVVFYCVAFGRPGRG
eukprot:6116509-Pyramimonas_sp.AAC.1